MAQSCKIKLVSSFANVLSFIKVSTGLDTWIDYSSHRSMSNKPWGPTDILKVSLVRWYEMLYEYNLCVDEFDETLGCIRLRRHRTIGQAGRLSFAAEHGLIPDVSKRSIVYLVKKNNAFDC